MKVLPVGVVACASTGEILFFNDRAVELWGRTPERFEPLQRFCGAFKMIRRDGTEVLPEEMPMARALRTRRDIEAVETILERPDGSRVVCVSCVRVLDDDLGINLGAIETFYERTRARLERLPSVEELRSAMEELRDDVDRIDRTVSRLVDLSEVARGVVARFGQEAIARDVSLVIDATEPVHAIGDARQLDDAIGRMVENALRFGRGHRVDLRVLRTPPSAELSVSSHGYGATFTMSLPLAS